MPEERAFSLDSRRLTLLVGCLVFGLTVIVGRLVYYQVLHHDDLAEEADQQRVVVQVIPAKRGYIADTNGNLLALEVVEWEISVSPALVTGAQELASQLSQLLALPHDEVLAALTSDVKWVRLATGVEYEIGEAIADLDAGGITCTPLARRYYPEGDLLAHIVGFVNDTQIGFVGAEGHYDQQLHGIDGRRVVEMSPVGEPLPKTPLEMTPPQDGSSLVLTVDRNIQLIAREELLRALETYGAQSGTVLIMDPQTGAILAAVSHPTYDPNDFEHADPDSMDDPAVSKMWEPGSIFKIITWSAGLDSGTISPGMSLYDEGALEVGGRVIRNWDRQGHGQVSMIDGLEQSLNTVAAFISTSMGKDRFYTYMRRFGFGTITNVDLAGEGPGIIKLPGDSVWFPSDLGTNSFGQGIAVTPMQMIVAASAVANQGTMMKPHIVRQFVTHDPQTGEAQIVEVDPMIVRHAISPQTAQTMTDLLVGVIERGATKAQVPGYRIAGKTGTAQIPTPYGYHPADTIASFVGFAPADDPQFIVLIKLDKPTASPWGSQTAAPTFRAIAERLFVYMQIPPDEIRAALGD